MTTPAPVDDTQALRGYLVECPVGFDHDQVKDLLERFDRAAETNAEAAGWYRRRLRTMRQGIEAAMREREEAQRLLAGRELGALQYQATTADEVPDEATTGEGTS